MTDENLKRIITIFTLVGFIIMLQSPVNFIIGLLIIMFIMLIL